MDGTRIGDDSPGTADGDVSEAVRNTLCIPLWGRMLAAQHFPHLFPDHDAKRILAEMHCDLSSSKLFKLQYAYLDCAIRQYDFACEINAYLAEYPRACVVELGAGLSVLRRQMQNESNAWYDLDHPQVIALRRRHIPSGERERNISCDLNDLSWFDSIDLNPRDGIVFIAGGLFYYFTTKEVRRLLVAMAERFRGGMIAFDTTNHRGLRGVNREVRMAGNAAKSYFSLEAPARELEAWSPNIVNVRETDYMRGYQPSGFRPSLLTKLVMKILTGVHMSFIVHAEFLQERTK